MVSIQISDEQEVDVVGVNRNLKGSLELLQFAIFVLHDFLLLLALNFLVLLVDVELLD